MSGYGGKMGREIRRVDADWEHPKIGNSNIYQPIYDKVYTDVLLEWEEQKKLWEEGKHPNQLSKDYDTNCTYEEWDGDAPDIKYYLTKPFKNPTWYQMYETVSEGTPVTPKFKTEEELINYLVESGTFWDSRGWEEKNAKHFVSIGWAPSGIMVKTGTKVEIKTPRDGI